MKKTTLIMLASASLLFATEPVVNTATNTPAGIKGMPSQSVALKKCKGMKCNNKYMARNYRKQMKVDSPFLIKHGLPRLSKMIMPYMDDTVFGLTADQKDKLAKLKASSMGVIMEIQPQVNVLRQAIIDASMTGASSDDLKDKVAKLALLEGTATMIHLKCIEETKNILTKDQLVFLLVNQNKKMWNKQKLMNKMKMRNK